jgi:D-glycero-alpha-D-manno-heptose-7-phosphate kinase
MSSEETMMVIVRAPLRISFGGGGTDLAAYYTRFGGYVVSIAISRYCYVVLNERDDGAIRISSADYHMWDTVMDDRKLVIESPLVLAKAVLKRFSVHESLSRGIDLVQASDVAPGTGLGSSSAMIVALIKAVATLCRCALSPQDIAELACSIEIEQLQAPIGKQDQYASALGGLNVLEFTAQGVQVTPLLLSAERISLLRKHLLLFSTGTTRNAATILTQQRANTQKDQRTIDILHRMKAVAMEMCEVLVAGELDRLGSLLHRSWYEKKTLLVNISSSAIDGYYTAALGAGALGGKIVGAGGGGFLLLYCPPLRQAAVRETMGHCGLRELPFAFDFFGADCVSHVGRKGSDDV